MVFFKTNQENGNIYKRHLECSKYTIKRLKEMNLKIFPKLENTSSPSNYFILNSY
jgi:aspartate aminotransferase-like enzyme